MKPKFNISTRFKYAMMAVFGPSQPLSAPGHWITTAVGGKTQSGITVNEWTALNLPAVYACVSRIANPIAMFPIQIFKDVNGQSVRDTTHPLNRILQKKSNPWMQPRTVMKTVQAHALLWGNGYIEIERNGKGEVTGLWPLLPWATHPVRDKEELVYRTVIDGNSFRLRDENVLHLMDLSLDGYCGLSQITLARAAVGLAQAAETFGEKFFANDARSGAFSSIRASWERRPLKIYRAVLRHRAGWIMPIG